MITYQLFGCKKKYAVVVEGVENISLSLYNIGMGGLSRT
jgi:hypothetical protein